MSDEEVQHGSARPLPARRPAEALAGTGSIALLVAYVVGLRDPEHVAVVGAMVGLIPAMVTTLVQHGGIRGLARTIWGGR